MQFIEDWKKQFPKLWSVRLSLLAGVMSSTEAGIELWLTGKPAMVAMLAALVSFAAAFARVVSQPDLQAVLQEIQDARKADE
ncbi:hypothetical protein [Cupriavidus sp. DL-D2]|uniref:DUF7940 domain-containing protein n=1 Tax=Cupriavidus sp. DL-D2 TaxID=3144974 RepID=UPI0032124952